jgi:hypothetical protein
MDIGTGSDIAAIVGGFTVLGLNGLNRFWKRRLRKELEKRTKERDELLLLASLLQQLGDEDLLRSEGGGQVAIISDGSFASSQLPYLLEGYVRASAAGFIGGIYLLEPDLGRKDVCEAQIPSVFVNRIAHANLYLYPGGMSGKSVFDVLQIRHKWEPEVKQGTQTWLKIIKARTKPAVLLVFVSSGGSAALARGPIEAFHALYPEVPIILVTILDEKTQARARFPEIRDYYCHDGLITQITVCDNRRNPKASDLGISMFFPGMTVASWLKPQSLELWNLGAYTFPQNGKVEPRFATLSVYAEYLPIRYVPAWKRYLPELYLTEAAAVEDAAMRGVRDVVENAARQSVALPKAGLGTTRVALVAAPIHPRDFAKNITRIDEGLEVWRHQNDIDVQVAYANIKAPMNPLTEQVPLVVVYLQPLQATAYDMDELALGKANIGATFLPRPDWSYEPHRSLEG